tara:strand:+ start:1301 stop:1906 length:606 start_codon:yes stop_codon:yes gene_type:complete
MKQCLLLLFFISGISTAFAQFEKGDRYVGGDFGFSLNKAESSTTSRSTYLAINLSPNLGYFISDLSVIGINPQVNFYWNKNITSNNEKISSNTVSGGIGLFFRRYFPVVDNFYFFLEPKATYNSSFEEESKPRSFGLSLSPGASYKISPKWMVEATLGGLVYHKSYNSSGANQEYDDTRFALDLITANSIGIIYFINQKDQ